MFSKKRGPKVSNVTHHLPFRVINNVKRFVFFIGYARSGHCIVASLLDAHPNVVIAHEYSLFSKWSEAHKNKPWLFETLVQNSQNSSAGGLRWENAERKVIRWQGKYDRDIYVIGDKAGGMTAQAYRKNCTAFNSTYHQLKKTLKGVRISVIHVLRNPYDNIAAMLLYNLHKRGSFNKSHKYVNDDELRNQIGSYFREVQGVADMIKKLHLDVIEVHNIDMISNPKQTIRELCIRLHLACPENYLHMCAQVTYPAESKSRESVQWTEDNIRIVAQKSQRFNSLKRYTY